MIVIIGCGSVVMVCIVWLFFLMMVVGGFLFYILFIDIDILELKLWFILFRCIILIMGLVVVCFSVLVIFVRIGMVSELRLLGWLMCIDNILLVRVMLRFVIGVNVVILEFGMCSILNEG